MSRKTKTKSNWTKLKKCNEMCIMMKRITPSDHMELSGFV